MDVVSGHGGKLCNDVAHGVQDLDMSRTERCVATTMTTRKDRLHVVEDNLQRTNRPRYTLGEQGRVSLQPRGGGGGGEMDTCTKDKDPNTS